jgi:Tfp pilus assembly protein PilO
MGANKAAPWVAGAVVLIFVILAMGWFLAISPTMAAADASRAQTAVERDHNALLTQQIATLKEQFTHLDEYKAQLAELQVQLPPQADLSALNTELQALVASAGLTTTTFGVTTAQAFVPVATAAAPVADAAATTAAGTTTAVAGTAATGAAPVDPVASFAGFYAVPVSITVVGTYDATLAFLDSLQTTTSRLYLVGSVTATSQRDGGAGSGKPATSSGDLETTIAGFAYVLQDGSAAVEAPAATPSPLPVPSNQKNPFIPVP